MFVYLSQQSSIFEVWDDVSTPLAELVLQVQCGLQYPV